MTSHRVWLSALAAVLLLPWAIHPAETSVKVSALLLECIGLAAVAFGLRETQRQFDIEPLDLRVQAAAARAWRRATRFFRKSRPPIEMHGGGGTAQFKLGGSAYLSVWRADPVDASIEQRLGVLWQNVNELKERFEFSDQRTREWLQQRDAAIALERDQRRTETERLNRMLREHAVGGLQLEGWGLLAILVSVPVGLFSKGINALATWLFT